MSPELLLPGLDPLSVLLRLRRELLEVHLRRTLALLLPALHEPAGRFEEVFFAGAADGTQGGPERDA